MKKITRKLFVDSFFRACQLLLTLESWMIGEAVHRSHGYPTTVKSAGVERFHTTRGRNETSALLHANKR